MNNLIYIAVVASGAIIDYKQRIKSGERKGQAGQTFNGKLYGYTYGTGIYTEHYDSVNDCMVVDEIVVGMDTIRKGAHDYFSHKRLCFVTNDRDTVYYNAVRALDNLEIILKVASLNTTPNRTGLIIRDVKDNLTEFLSCEHETLKTFCAAEFCAEYLEMKEFYPKMNLGNFSEYKLSGKLSDIDDRRFRQKKTDVNYEGKRYELKASLTLPVKDKSASSSNMFYYITK